MSTPKDQQATAKQQVLISGASFAGLATAWWMHRMGYAVTVVELAADLRKGGTPVDIRDDVIAIVERMGLLEQIAAKGLPPRSFEMLQADGTSVARIEAEQNGGPARPGWEIERDDLLDLLYERVRGNVTFRFNDSIAAVQQFETGVDVEFKSGERGSYSLLFGCDGTHSAVRRLCFGPESDYLHFMGMYFSLSVVRKELLEPNSSQMVNMPGKVIMLNGYADKSDVGLCFASDEEISYDRRDVQQQRQMITKYFEGESWRTPELLAEMWHCENFYFDKLCQIRMPSWTKGRVALVGDAGYCPSPAAGLGGSIALLGAAALADAMAKHPDDLDAAFAEYNTSFRPFVDRIQATAVKQAYRMLNPSAEGVMPWEEE